MSLDPDELAIREAFARRRPAAVPPELLERVAAVPGEVRPLRPMPVRLALGVAPWLAVAAAGIVFAFGPRLAASLAGPGPGVGADPGTAWTPANPGGGFVNEGIFALPWVPMLPLLALLVAGWTLRRIRSGGPIVPTRADVWRTLTWRASSVRQVLAYTVPMLGLLALFMAVATGDPIVFGSAAAPGPEMTELRQDGVSWDETQGPGQEPQDDGQRYIFAMRPGESFSTVVSIRNVWPVPITILGLARRDGVTTADLLQGADAVENGLGLLRDPQRISAWPGDVGAFMPFEMAPGEDVALVVAYTAGSCADPASDSTLDPSAGGRGITIVYDLFGWRRTGSAWPPFELTVPASPGCAG